MLTTIPPLAADARRVPAWASGVCPPSTMRATSIDLAVFMCGRSDTRWRDTARSIASMLRASARRSSTRLGVGSSAIFTAVVLSWGRNDPRPARRAQANSASLDGAARRGHNAAMHVYESWTGLPPEARGGSVALGNFDGVHRGHAAVVATAHAARPDATLSALTFEPHPRELFRPDDPPFHLTLPPARNGLLGRLGVSVVHQVPFDRAFSGIDAGGFVEQVLHAGVGAAHVVCGPDFAFGHRRGGDVALLIDRCERLGIGVTIAPHLVDGAGVVSSTRIRRLLQDGYPERAASLLGRPWAIEGEVAHGDRAWPDAGVPDRQRAARPPPRTGARGLRGAGGAAGRRGGGRRGQRRPPPDRGRDGKPARGAPVSTGPATSTARW